MKTMPTKVIKYSRSIRSFYVRIVMSSYQPKKSIIIVNIAKSLTLTWSMSTNG